MNQKLFLCFAVVVLVACSSDKPKITSTTLATVNNRTISENEFIEQAEAIKNTPGINLSSADGRTNVLREMINEDLVFQEAIKDEFYLKDLNVKHEVVKQYLKQKFGKELPSVSEAQIKSFYEKNKELVEEVRASHILIKVDSKADASTKQSAKEKLQALRNDILRGKISFADAAIKNSQDASAENGGDVGYFNRTKMVKPFSDAVFKLQNVGDISPVIETEFGYHVIQLTADQRGYEKNSERIRWKLYQDVMQPKVDEYFQKLRESAKINIIDKDIMSIPVPNS